MSRRATTILLLVAPLVLLVVVGAVLAMRGGASTDTSSAASLNPHPIAGNFKPDDTKLADCSDQRCWEQAFGNLSYREGPKPALAEFDKEIASDRAVESGCHRIAHMIGSAALARYKGNVARAFAEGSSSCWSGYYHGILERALFGVSSKAELVTVVRRLCADKSVRANTFILYQCVHGIGHGLMIHTGLDLPMSLSVCEQLTTAWDQTSCDGGVFMENFNSSYGVKSRFLKDDDPVYPCNSVAERHKFYCYLQVTDRLLASYGYDWDKTAKACAAVEKNWRATCFQSYGRSASGTSRLDAAKLIEFCNVPAKEWRSDCVYGAVRDIVSNDAGAARAKGFCERVAVDLRGRCFNGAGTIIFDLAGSPERQRAQCLAITKRYLDNCLLQKSG
jgi:hypothetical protein